MNLIIVNSLHSYKTINGWLSSGKKILTLKKLNDEMTEYGMKKKSHNHFFFAFAAKNGINFLVQPRMKQRNEIHKTKSIRWCYKHK